MFISKPEIIQSTIAQSAFFNGLDALGVRAETRQEIDNFLRTKNVTYISRVESATVIEDNTVNAIFVSNAGKFLISVSAMERLNLLKVYFTLVAPDKTPVPEMVLSTELVVATQPDIEETETEESVDSPAPDDSSPTD